MNQRSVNRVLRFKETVITVGLSRSTIYRLIQDGAFVPMRRLSAHAVGFLESDIEAWLASRAVVEQRGQG